MTQLSLSFMILVTNICLNKVPVGDLIKYKAMKVLPPTLLQSQALPLIILRRYIN